MRRRHALQLIAGLSGGLLLHACGQKNDSGSSSDELTTISIATIPWIGLTPLYIAEDKGFFEEEGVALDLNTFSANGEALSAFVAGRLTAMSAVSSEVIIVKSQDKDFKVVMVEDNSVGADGILARDSVTDVADFKGKKVAVDQSGTSYFFLLQVLKEAGLTKEDITAINIDSAGAAAAYQSGNVDIAVTYAPFLQQADNEVSDGRIIYDSAKMPTAIIDMYLFDTAFVTENPEAVQGFVNAVFKGLDFLNNNREDGLAIAAARLEIDPEALESDLSGIKLPDISTNQAMITNPESDLYIMPSLTELADFLAEQGEIDTPPSDLSSIIDTQFVQAATT